VLTENFFLTLAAQLAVQAGPTWYLAVGAGNPAWDRNAPLPLRYTARLANELARKPLAPDDVRFLDLAGAETEAPSPRLRLRVRFESDEGNGVLREVGLFANASAAPDSGTLLSYFVHAPIEKTANMSLERVVRLDLTPRAVSGMQPTRFLGNSRSREVHDLENPKPACQVNEMPFDRRVFFASAEQAIEAGYDYCAYCFGRASSTR